MNISGPAAVAKPEMLFYAPGDLTVTLQYSHSKGYEQTKAPKLNKTKKKGETNHGSPR